MNEVCPICHEDNDLEILFECTGCGAEGLNCCVSGNPPLCVDCSELEMDEDDFENELEEEDEDNVVDLEEL